MKRIEKNNDQNHISVLAKWNLRWVCLYLVVVILSVCCTTNHAHAVLLMGPPDLVNITSTNVTFPFAGIAAGIDGVTTDGDIGQAINQPDSSLPITMTVTFNSDNIYQITDFHLWNDYGAAERGWDAFSLTFKDPSGLQIGPVFSGNGIAQAGASAVPDDFSLGFTYLNVRSVDILLTSSHAGAGIDNQFREVAFTGDIVEIPEPSTFLLLGLGALGLARHERRRRRRAEALGENPINP